MKRHIKIELFRTCFELFYQNPELGANKTCVSQALKSYVYLSSTSTRPDEFWWYYGTLQKCTIISSWTKQINTHVENIKISVKSTVFLNMCCELFISISFTLLLYDTEKYKKLVSYGSDFIFKQNPVSTKNLMFNEKSWVDYGRFHMLLTVHLNTCWE